MAQFKERKMIYFSEIQRLSKIVSTSIESIPELLLTQNGPSRVSSVEKIPRPPHFIKKKSEYNTISSTN